MKKNIVISMIFAACASLLNAQITEFDAMNLARRDINGTARYMGMAGAFGALGGDVSAIKDNPAGLGIYRSSELTVTFNMHNQRTTSKWYGNTAHDNLFRPDFSNVAYIMSFPTYSALNGQTNGLLQSNWGFSYNRLRDFNRDVTVKNSDMATSLTDYMAFFSNSNDYAVPSNFTNARNDFDNVNLSWLNVMGYYSGVLDYDNGWKTFLNDGDLTNYRYNLRERGYMDEFSLSWGGNFSNIIYIGAALNLTTLYHTRLIDYFEDYSSYSPNLSMSTYIKTTGYGVNFNLGIIARPFDSFRLGLAFQTPTRYFITDDVYNTYMQYNSTLYAPDSYTDYELRTPWKLTASAAYIIGTRAIVSTDFVYTNYQNTKLYDNNGSSTSYDYENEVMQNNFKNGLLFKAGFEYRLTDNFSLRAGAAGEVANVNDDIYKNPLIYTTRIDTDYYIYDGTTYFTLGAGYRSNFFYLDLAFVNKNIFEKFAPYAYGLDLAKVTTRNFDIVATVGFRF